MKPRDLDLLSLYLDEQLNSSDSARLESRIASDGEVASAFEDMKLARGILRKLPKRKAPRNFTLTRKMVGLNPPLPRSYGFFRFTSAFASLLLALSFAFNFAAPRLSYTANVPAFYGGSGGGGNGGVPVLESQPLAQDSASAVGTEAPVAEAPAMAAQPTPLATISGESENSAAEKSAQPTPAEAPVTEAGTNPESPEQAEIKHEAVISSTWQVLFAGILILTVALSYLIRHQARRKWK